MARNACKKYAEPGMFRNARTGPNEKALARQRNKGWGMLLF